MKQFDISEKNINSLILQIFLRKIYKDFNFWKTQNTFDSYYIISYS